MSSSVQSFKKVAIVVTGECLRNSGPGGFGAVLLYKQHRKELSGGFAKTTQKRLALFGAITAIEALKAPCDIELYYVQVLSHSEPELEEDLLDRIKLLRRKHGKLVQHQLYRIDAHPEGPRCLQLARDAPRLAVTLPPDRGYLDVIAQAAARQRSHEEAQQSIAQAQAREWQAELALSPQVRSLRQQIRELVAMIEGKTSELSTYTLDDRLHDRKYEIIQRDKEKLEKLQHTLAEAERKR